MKKITVLLLLLISTLSFAGTAQLNSVVGFNGNPNGSTPFTILPQSSALTSVITLIATVNSSTGGNALAFYKDGVQYQVGSGKTFVGFGWHGYASSATGIGFGTATASFSNDVAVGTLTGPVYYSGAAGKTYKSVSTTDTFYPYIIKFAQNLYPFVNITGGTANVSITIVGQEY